VKTHGPFMTAKGAGRERGAPRRRVPVYVVLPPRTLLLDVAGPLEVLRRANMVQERVRFDVHYVGPTASVMTSIGLAMTGIDPLPDALPASAMVMLMGNVEIIMPATHRSDAGAGAETGADAGAGLLARARSPRADLHTRAQSPFVSPARSPSHARVRSQAHADASRDADDQDDTAIVAWLRAVIQPGHTLVSICSGAILAGRAGLLDGYACTTHYGSCGELAAIAPKARVLENRLYVEDRDRFSSAGVTAGIDLMLHLVSGITDHACALAIARYLVVYLRRGGADPQLSPWLEGRNHIHPAIHRVQDAVTADPARSWTLDALADVAGASARHLSRLFNEQVGMSITDYRNRLRVALARELLGHTRLDMEHIAERAGFASTRQLRRAWRQLYATPPKDAREPQQA
jgi:transcriptional regulator GlxA family with amidase domain